MASVYNPNGCIPQATAPAPVAISSSTNASPIAITTAAPHGYTSGDTVQIIGHQTNTGANGLWVIAVTGASTFTLTGSTGVAVGGATGQAQNFSVNPLLTLPGDGDLESASSVNAPISGQANVAPFLYQRVGAYNLHAIYEASDFTAVGQVYSTTVLPATTWTALTSITNLFAALGDRYLASGDRLDLRIGTSLRVDAGLQFALAIGISYNGGAYSPIGGTVRNAENSNASRIVLGMECADVLSSGWSANDRFDLALMGFYQGGGGNMDIWSGFSAVVRHYRSNA